MQASYQLKQIKQQVSAPAVQRLESGHSGMALQDNRPGSVAQLAKRTITKGTIIDSVVNEKASSKGAKPLRGQISGGVSNAAAGTPGTRFAGDVAGWADRSDSKHWMGGHVYKHQWGGAVNNANIVVWPQAAESLWASGFENSVESNIDRGLHTAIGVSWTVDDEMVTPHDMPAIPQVASAAAASSADDSAASSAPAMITSPEQRVYVARTTEIERRKANEALSYVPEVVAGHCNSRTTVFGSDITAWDFAKAGAIANMHHVMTGKAAEYTEEHAKGHFARKVQGQQAAVAVNPATRSNAKYEAAYEQEMEHKGHFGNVRIT